MWRYITEAETEIIRKVIEEAVIKGAQREEDLEEIIEETLRKIKIIIE